MFVSVRGGKAALDSDSREVRAAEKSLLDHGTKNGLLSALGQLQPVTTPQGEQQCEVGLLLCL